MSRFFLLLAITCAFALPAIAIDFPDALTPKQKKHYEDLYESVSKEWRDKIENSPTNEALRDSKEAKEDFENHYQSLVYAQSKLNLAKKGTEEYNKWLRALQNRWASVRQKLIEARFSSRFPSMSELK